MAKPRSKLPRLLAFGSYLRSLRASRSRQQISNRLAAFGARLDESTLVQYENGSVWAPDAVVLSALAAIYDVPLRHLVSILATNRQFPDALTVSDLSRHAEPADWLDPGASPRDPQQPPSPDRLSQLEARIAELEIYESIVGAVRPLLLDAVTALGAPAAAPDAGTPERRRRAGATHR